MTRIQPGDKIPPFTWKAIGAEGITSVSSDTLFPGRRVVLFAVPGAFTPTCHQNHFPGFLENLEAFKAKGIDQIAVVAVNDIWVLEAWAEKTGGKGKILFLADGSASFVRSLGLELDATTAGLGVRAQRFSMLVEDGIVKILNVEPVASEAKIASGAALLAQIEAR